MNHAPNFTDEDILSAWRSGKDTVDMAKMFWRSEAEMYQRLHRVLENNRTAEWDFDGVVWAFRKS